MIMSWTLRKKAHLDKLSKANEEKALDLDVLPLLKKINGQDSYYSTSSCSGRILLLQSPKDHEKRQSVFLGKWHNAVSEEEFDNALNTYSKDVLWCMVQPAIFHIVCQTLENASALVKKAQLAGFKHTTILTLEPHIVVEIRNTIHISVPIGKEGLLIVDAPYLEFLRKTANDKLSQIKKGLKKLGEHLDR